MKQIILTFFAFFLLTSPLYPAKTVDLQVQLTLGQGIDKKYERTFNEVIRYWIKEETLYRPSKTAGLRLAVAIEQKLNRYVLKAELKKISDESTLKEGHTYFDNLSDFFEALDKVFYQMIFSDKLHANNRPYTYLPSSIDIAFMLDSTGSMREELDYIKKDFRNLFSKLMWNLKTSPLRFALLDYKNPIASYRVELTNFSHSLETLIDRFNAIDAVGKGNGDVNYALMYLLNYGDFKAQNRIVFIITDSGPIHKVRFLELLEKAKGMNIKLIILGADGISAEDAAFYQQTFTRYPGAFSHLSYFFQYTLKDNTLKQFLFQNRALWEIQNQDKVDITLGRQQRYVRGIKSFLLQEGYPVSELKELDINLGEIFDQFTAPYRKKIPLVILEAEGKQIKVGVQDLNSLKYLKNKRGKKVTLGGHFFPFYDSVSIYPHSLRIQQNPLSAPLLQSLTKIIHNPFFYYSHGIFEPSIWFITATVKGFE